MMGLTKAAREGSSWDGVMGEREGRNRGGARGVADSARGYLNMTDGFTFGIVGCDPCPLLVKYGVVREERQWGAES